MVTNKLRGGKKLQESVIAELREVIEKEMEGARITLQEKGKKLDEPDTRVKGHEADSEGPDHSEQSLRAREISRAQEILTLGNNALIRMSLETFGVCLDRKCGEPIEEARLRTNPYTIFCAACARERDPRAKKTPIAGSSRNKGVSYVPK